MPGREDGLGFLSRVVFGSLFLKCFEVILFLVKLFLDFWLILKNGRQIIGGETLWVESRTKVVGKRNIVEDFAFGFHFRFGIDDVRFIACFRFFFVGFSFSFFFFFWKVYLDSGSLEGELNYAV